MAEVQAIQHIAIRKKKKWGFYGYSTIKHNYVMKTIGDNKIVIDHATKLMWHQSGSTYGMNWEKAKRWVKLLNKRGYAGYYDWRLPTIEEASSLLEPSKTFYNVPPKVHQTHEHYECDESCKLPLHQGTKFHRLHEYGNPQRIPRQHIQDKQLRVQKSPAHKPDSNRRIHTDRFIDPIFDKTQGWIWTGDNFYRPDASWRVDFFSGLVDWDIHYYTFYHVRPVRTMK